LLLSLQLAPGFPLGYIHHIMKNTCTNDTVSSARIEELVKKLEARFEDHMERHQGLEWMPIRQRLESNGKALASLLWMEETGGEPDVMGYDEESDTYLFCDCSAESPSGRRSLCYDAQALEARKQNKPTGSAVGTSEEHGLELLDEERYRALQRLGTFDTKTSSWLKTPEHIRRLGGAIFGDRRYDTVFIYHNGADSYYGARGFRALLSI